MGGLLAAYLSVRYPVRRLILLNTAVIYVSPGRMLDVFVMSGNINGKSALLKGNPRRFVPPGNLRDLFDI